MRYPIYETEMLIKPVQGIYLVTTYYSDGTRESREVPKGPVVIPAFYPGLV